MARESADIVQQMGADQRRPISILVDGRSIELPVVLNDVLGLCLNLTAEGQSVAVMPAEQEIGTQEAAEMMGVSRPHLVKLLDGGRIPSRKVGVQRRVRVEDILAYRSQ